VTGDYTGAVTTGAVTAACGAIDLATQHIYTRDGLGDPAKVAFAAKVCTALNQRGVVEGLERGYTAAGMAEPDARRVRVPAEGHQLKNGLRCGRLRPSINNPQITRDVMRAYVTVNHV
jgi:hypothetical protein